MMKRRSNKGRRVEYISKRREIVTTLCFFVSTKSLLRDSLVLSLECLSIDLISFFPTPPPSRRVTHIFSARHCHSLSLSSWFYDNVRNENLLYPCRRARIEWHKVLGEHFSPLSFFRCHAFFFLARFSIRNTDVRALYKKSPSSFKES